MQQSFWTKVRAHKTFHDSHDLDLYIYCKSYFEVHKPQKGGIISLADFRQNTVRALVCPDTPFCLDTLVCPDTLVCRDTSA